MANSNYQSNNNDLLKSHKIFFNQQIDKCVDDKTLFRYEAGLKMIVTSNEIPVFMVIDQFISQNGNAKKFAIDLSNQKLFAQNLRNVSYFFNN